MKDKKVLIVGIIATNGSGKTTIAKLLAKQFGYVHYSVREYLIKLFIEKNGAHPISQAEIGDFGNSLRFEKGPETAIREIVQSIIGENKSGAYIIESIRCPGEVQFLFKICEENKVILKLIGLDAPDEQRYNRLIQRADFKAPRDVVEFRANEGMEWAEKDPWKMSIGKCLEYVAEEAMFENLNGHLNRTVGEIQDYLVT